MTDSERRRVITSTPHFSPEEIAARTFGVGWRGFAESEVRAFLKRVSEQIAAGKEREEDLQAEITSLHEQLLQPRPLDEKELLDALGEETARLLRSAREASDEIQRKADERAAAIIDEANADADRIRAAAEDVQATRMREADEYHASRLADAEERVQEIVGTAETRVQDLRDSVEGLAETALESARQKGREMLDEAKSARERVLADLVRRRALLQAQIEELRVGRDRLIEAYRTVKRTFLDATEALSEVEIRAAQERATNAPEPLDIAAEIAAEIEALEAGEHGDGEPDATVAVVDITEDGTGEVGADDVTAGSAEIAAGAGAAGEPIDEAGAADADQPREMLADVDTLFARIRAGSDFVAPPPPETPPADEEPAQEAGVAEVDTDATGAEDDATATPPAGVNVAEADGASAGDAWRAMRSRELDPLLGPLLKVAKREAQDDQNALLDAVRRHKGRPRAEKVLPDPDATLASWSAVLAESVDQAYAAGRVAAGGAAADASDALRREAADVVVDPLRQRLAAAVDSGDDGGLVERIGARFREWKNQSLETALAEVLALAWARGVYDAAPDGAVLRWVPYEEGRCTDCDDNGLQPTVKGTEFPTGQLCPPAHPGCRCLVVPAELLVAPSA